MRLGEHTAMETKARCICAPLAASRFRLGVSASPPYTSSAVPRSSTTMKSTLGLEAAVSAAAAVAPSARSAASRSSAADFFMVGKPLCSVLRCFCSGCALALGTCAGGGPRKGAS